MLHYMKDLIILISYHTDTIEWVSMENAMAIHRKIEDALAEAPR